MTGMDSPDPQPSGTAPRRTVQRDAVLGALETKTAFISAQELFDSMRDGDIPVALATVYRHLNAFVDAGLADTVWRNGHQLFRACSSSASHFHAVCEACGRDSELAPPLAALLNEAAMHGFVVEHVTVEVLGRCLQCVNGSGVQS